MSNCVTIGQSSAEPDVHSYIPLLLLPIPLSLSPVHLTILLGVTYLLNRPCLYCSLLLIILLATSCHWQQTCLIDFDFIPKFEGGSGYATWFVPKSETINEKSWKNQSNQTLAYLASALAETAVAGFSEASVRIRGKDILAQNATGYLSSFFGSMKSLMRKEWVLPCIGVRVAI